jgi:hypothetical protein
MVFRRVMTAFVLLWLMAPALSGCDRGDTTPSNPSTPPPSAPTPPPPAPTTPPKAMPASFM